MSEPKLLTAEELQRIAGGAWTKTSHRLLAHIAALEARIAEMEPLVEAWHIVQAAFLNCPVAAFDLPLPGQLVMGIDPAEPGGDFTVRSEG